MQMVDGRGQLMGTVLDGLFDGGDPLATSKGTIAKRSNKKSISQSMPTQKACCGP